MNRVLIIAVCVPLLPGCLASIGIQGGNAGVVAPATQPSVGPGGSFSSAGVSARFSDGSPGAALLGAGILGFLFGRGDSADARRVPDLDPNRTVNQQACRQAIADPASNLRCR